MMKNDKKKYDIYIDLFKIIKKKEKIIKLKKEFWNKLQFFHCKIENKVLFNKKFHLKSPLLAVFENKTKLFEISLLKPLDIIIKSLKKLNISVHKTNNYIQSNDLIIKAIENLYFRRKINGNIFLYIKYF